MTRLGQRSRFAQLALVALVVASCASTRAKVQAGPANSSPTPGGAVETTAFVTTTALAGVAPTNAPGDCSAATVIAGEPPPTAQPDTTACVSQAASPLETLRNQLESQLDWNSGRISTVGLNGQGTAVEVDLRADAKDIAAHLVKRYGSKVVVRLGLFPYPPATSADVMPAQPCGDAPSVPTDQDAAALAVTIEPSGPVHSGAGGQAVVHVRNVSSQPYSLETGSALFAVVVRPGTRTIIGADTGGIAGTGLSVTLQPGQDTTINAIFGTASCEETLGYALPPGDYQLIGLLERSGLNGVLPSIPSAPATVHIIP